MARLSKLIENAQKELKKDNGDATGAINAIKEKIDGAITAYAGKDAVEGAYERNSGVKTDTVEGVMPMSVLDEASLLTVLSKQQKRIVVEVLGADKDENYSQNAELARAIATNSQILGAVHYLAADDAGENDFL
jgi:hypothetical protein